MALLLPIAGWAATAYATIIQSKKQQTLQSLESQMNVQELSQASQLVHHTVSEFSLLHKLVSFSREFFYIYSIHTMGLTS